ncbi:MAG TPA: methylenetetrahydrofolate reductase [Clostridiales bacterium]|nr:methylenetetrahydrofolate reductase [Clostridiales bacterium]
MTGKISEIKPDNISDTISNLQRILEAGHFSVTAEIGPPMSANADFVRGKARDLAGLVDAANVTDNQTAIVRMSSVAASYLIQQEGMEPVLQMTCRDRNRIAIQSDLLGAYALGLRNVLCLSGDHQSFGNHPQSKNVYDIDSIQLINALRIMKEEKTFMCGRTTKTPAEFFIGATANPFADPEELQFIRLHKKVAAGAQFIQTQAIYDLEKFSTWMEKVRKEGLHEKTYILAGILVNKSLKSIEMTKKVAGMVVPDIYVERMKKAASQEEEGVRIALDLIGEIRKIEGIKGIHIMAVGWESIVPKIVEKAGFLPRPVL